MSCQKAFKSQFESWRMLQDVAGCWMPTYAKGNSRMPFDQLDASLAARSWSESGDQSHRQTSRAKQVTHSDSAPLVFSETVGSCWEKSQAVKTVFAMHFPVPHRMRMINQNHLKSSLISTFLFFYLYISISLRVRRSLYLSSCVEEGLSLWNYI